MTAPVIILEPYDVSHKNLIFSVIIAYYQGQYLLCRHRDRTTWEVSGGHIETGEIPLQAAERELYEESGALDYVLFPAHIYGVTRDSETRYGALYYAEIFELGELCQD